MGELRMGPPSALVLAMAKAFGLEVFVETGTFKGETTRWAGRHFERVYSVEASRALYERAIASVGRSSKIHLRHGDSREQLPAILAELDARRAVVWLDAHWSGGVTHGREDECPLLGELAAVFQANTRHFILIDDARLFLAPPPIPHDPKAWPTVVELACHVREQDYGLILHDDVFLAYPEDSRGFFVDYLRNARGGA